jgi:ABC-type Fe3+-hydroxamate transport system substrate-binding protein
MKYFSYLVIILIGFSFISCQRNAPLEEEVQIKSSYEVLVNDKNPPQMQAVKMVDVVALLESEPESGIIEFSGGPWSIAVKNLDTGYTYYYDSSNNFLGRKGS